MPLILLPLISSAFVPVDAMPGWFQPIAEYQPFTPAIETLRGLLLGTEIGNNGWLAIAWCLGLDRARLPLVEGPVQPRPEMTRAALQLLEEPSCSRTHA